MIASRDNSNKNKLSKKALPHSLSHTSQCMCTEEEQVHSTASQNEILVLGSVLLHGSNLSYAWQGLEWYSPAVLGGNQRPGAGGSACGQKGHPPRDWCTCLGPTLTLCVWPEGLLGLLCTQDGWPSERTAGSIAGDYRGRKGHLGSITGQLGHTKLNTELPATGICRPVSTSTT